MLDSILNLTLKSITKTKTSSTNTTLNKISTFRFINLYTTPFLIKVKSHKGNLLIVKHFNWTPKHVLLHPLGLKTLENPLKKDQECLYLKARLNQASNQKSKANKTILMRFKKKS